MSLSYNKKIFALLLALGLGVLFAKVANFFLDREQNFDISVGVEGLDYSLDLVAQASLQKKQNVQTAQSKEVEIAARLSEFVLSATMSGAIEAVIVEYRGSNELLYVGDSYRGYTLKEVGNASAVFEQNGREYLIYMFEPAAVTKEEQKDANAQRESEVQRIVSQTRGMFDEIKYEDGVYFIPRPLVREYMNLDVVFSQIQIIGMFVNGEFDGFMVRNVSAGSIFARLGLQRGDKITHIDGKRFTNMNEPFEYFNKLDTLMSINLTLERQNKEMELSYEIY